MRSLTLKLVLAFVIVGVVGSVLFAVLIGYRTSNEFENFASDQWVSFALARLGDFYQHTGSWEGAGSGGLSKTLLSAPVDPQSQPRDRSWVLPWAPGIQPVDERASTWRVLIATADGVAVNEGLGYLPGDEIRSDDIAGGHAILVDGVQVGTMLTVAPRPRTNPLEDRFLQGFSDALLISTAAATFLSLLLGLVLARSLSRPVSQLTAATRAVAQGDLSQRVPVRRRDEVGLLAESFNNMTQDLQNARKQRRQMTADIAHDLRTPLSLILGHSEALADGILEPTPERLGIIHDEAQRLERLVDDLRTLSLADDGCLPLAPEAVEPALFLERIVSAHRACTEDLGVELVLELDPEAPETEFDPGRFAQVLDNLLANALRHVPQGGRVTVGAGPANEGLRVWVQDTGPGIDQEDLEHIFDRMYRGDKSRQRDGSGSGLGLTIARSIVEAHGGRIWAESEEGNGARFTIELPLLQPNSF